MGMLDNIFSKEMIEKLIPKEALEVFPKVLAEAQQIRIRLENIENELKEIKKNGRTGTEIRTNKTNKIKTIRSTGRMADGKGGEDSAPETGDDSAADSTGKK